MQTENHNLPPSVKSSLSGSKSAASGKPIFVIKKHDTKILHYDFHLELDGILKSWAVLKGLSTNPGENRLAVATDDHPLEHARFEGTIPEHRYGAGTVMVWDTGTYDNLMIREDKPIPVHKCYENGQIVVYLHGKRVSGGFILIKSEEKQMEGSWLLIKMNDNKAGARLNSVTAEDKSILTGRTLNQIKMEARESH